MGAFELRKDERAEELVEAASARPDPRRLREECIIAFKVYDSCRQPHCKNYLVFSSGY